MRLLALAVSTMFDFIENMENDFDIFQPNKKSVRRQNLSSRKADSILTLVR